VGLYCIKAKGTHFVKIGITADATPKKRLAGLQTASPFELEILTWITGVDAVFEAYCHRELAPMHVRGEWFKLNPQAVRRAIRGVKQKVTINTSEDDRADAFSLLQILTTLT
jgi:hypothetical protein